MENAVSPIWPYSKAHPKWLDDDDDHHRDDDHGIHHDDDKAPAADDDGAEPTKKCTATALNGTTGVILSWDPIGGRYSVSLDRFNGAAVACLPSSLVVWRPNAAGAAGPQ